MKFNFITEGNMPDLHCKLAHEGHDCSVYVASPHERAYLYNNIWNPLPVYALNPSNITIADIRGGKRHYPQFKKFIAGNRVAERIELDREDGIKLAKKVGLHVPPYEVFNSPTSAIKWLKNQKDNYVVKLDKNFSDYTAGSTSFVGQNNEQATEFLQSLPKKTPKILLQKKIKGIELSTEGWVSPSGEILNLNHTIEQKGLLNKDMGPSTGCSCTDAVWNVPRDSWEDDIVGKYLTRPAFTDFVNKIGYVGPWDVNTIIDNDGTVFFLEWTPGFGYSAVYAWGELLLDEWGGLFRKLFDNTPIDAREDVMGYSVRIWLPPYPLKIADEKLDHEIFKHSLRGKKLGMWNKLIENPHIHLLDVYKEDDAVRCAGIDGIIAEVSGLSSIKKPSFNFQRHLSNFDTNDLCYRTDVGSRFMSILPQLQKYNLL